jgi:polysaccharide pyruvyl transferase WcaK-like protein
MLDDFGEHWRAMPYDIFKWSLAARLTGRPFAFVSIGAGPVAGSISKRLFKWAARMASYRSYRDLDSRKFMEGLSAKFGADPVYCDLAFMLPSPERHQSAEFDRALTIGVGVMSYYGWHAAVSGSEEIYETYVAKVTRFVVWLLGRGYRVRLVIGAAADTRVVDDVMQRVSLACGQLPVSQLIAEPAWSLPHLLEQLAGVDAIVGTRFHNIVAAIMMGLPAISIGYAAKNDALLSQAGLAHFCQRIDALDVDTLIGQFESLVAERERLADEVVKLRDAFRRCAEQQAKQVVSRFMQ